MNEKLVKADIDFNEALRRIANHNHPRKLADSGGPKNEAVLPKKDNTTKVELKKS